MKVLPLGKISEFIMGQAPPGRECNKKEKGTPFVKAGEFSEIRPIIQEWTTRPLKIAKRSDILICVVGATSGKLNLGEDCAIGRSVAAIRPYENEVDQSYLYNYLKTWTLRLRSLSQGCAQGVITKDMLHNVPVPLPPLAAQRRITSLLDQGDFAVQKRREAIRFLDDFLKATFLEMFGDPNNNSKSWPIRCLGDIAKLDMGGTPSTKRRDFYENGTICWMKSGDIKGDYIFDVPNKITELGVKCSNTKKYPKGAVVIALNGQGKTRGTTAILALETASNQSVAAITNFEDYLTAEFLHFQLKLRYKQLRNITGDNERSGLNLTILRNLKIILPPKSKQENFKRIVLNVLELSRKMKASEVELQNLFNCLMQKAFKGELL